MRGNVEVLHCGQVQGVQGSNRLHREGRPSPLEYLLVEADNYNKRVWILDRESLVILGRFGEGGNHGGQFNMPHSIATDSKGNICVGETLEGKRIQRFLFKGVK